MWFFTGLLGEDDILYSAAAFRISQGSLESMSGVRDMRMGLVAPMALLYTLLGVNAATLAAVNLAASLSLVALAYRFGKDLHGEQEGRWAAAFVAVLPLDVFHTTEVHADLPQAALAAASIYQAWSASTRLSGNRAVLACVAS